MTGSPTRRCLALAVLFLALHLARIPFHEMWRDEWHSWLTAGGSANPLELSWNTRFDGHPLFWPLLVWGVSRLASSAWIMAALNAAIAAAAAFVILRWAPFPRWLGVLLLCGYFPFYEYAVISRGYALSMLLAAICCALICAGRLRPLALGVALGLLAWSTFYGALLTLAFLAVLAADAAFQPALPATRRAPRSHTWGALALGAALTALAILDAKPAAGSGSPGWMLGWDTPHFWRSAAAVFRGLVPVPHFGVAFWNSNFLGGRYALAGGLGLLLAILAGLLLKRGRARLFWLVAAAALLGFTYTRFWGQARHHGFFLLALACGSWIAAANGSPGELGWIARWRVRLAVALLVVHAAAAGYATAVDWRHPFSASVELARWLREHRLDTLPIVAERDTRVSPLAGLLGTPLFYVRGQRWGTFVSFDAVRGREPSLDDILAGALAVEKERQSPVLVVLSDAATRTAPPGFQLLASFTHAIETTETYVVYARPGTAVTESSRDAARRP